MAAGWPTKVTYANGDVFNASDINDTNGTLNYINPTSATDNQVLTRDNAASGKVKWANSPANTLTTTGDLYYASAANTPARLPIGSTSQILTVSGGIPAWVTGGGGMTLLTTANLAGVGTYTFSSINQTYKNLVIFVTKTGPNTTNDPLYLRVNGYTGTACYSQSSIFSTATAVTNATATQITIGQTHTASAVISGQITIYNYSDTVVNNKQITATSGSLQANTSYGNGYNVWANVVGTTASAFDGIPNISSVTIFSNSGANFITGSTAYLYGVK